MIVLVEACATLNIELTGFEDIAKKICKEEYFVGAFDQAIADDIKKTLDLRRN